MSARLMWPIEEAPPRILAPQDVPATWGQSRTEQEHQNSVMLLEAVACLRELSEIVLRHERMLAAQTSLVSVVGNAQGTPATASLLQSHDLEDNLSASQVGQSAGSINDQNRSRIVPRAKREMLPLSFSFLLSAFASASGLALVYVLFLR